MFSLVHEAGINGGTFYVLPSSQGWNKWGYHVLKTRPRKVIHHSVFHIDAVNVETSRKCVSYKDMHST